MADSTRSAVSRLLLGFVAHSLDKTVASQFEKRVAGNVLKYAAGAEEYSWFVTRTCDGYH